MMINADSPQELAAWLRRRDYALVTRERLSELLSAEQTARRTRELDRTIRQQRDELNRLRAKYEPPPRGLCVSHAVC